MDFDEVMRKEWAKEAPQIPTTPQPTQTDYFNQQPTEITIEETFKKYLPETLFKSHYTLAQDYGFTPEEWRKFLRDNQMFIDTELAAIAEAEARSALARLGNATGQEVQAFKAILEKSKLINDSQKQATKIILTHIPPTEEKP